MSNTYWNTWDFGWDWLLWIGFMVLIFSSLGNWRYTYSAHRRYDGTPDKDALTILDERYARGDITREDYALMKTEIAR